MSNLIRSQVIQAPRQQNPKQEEDPLGAFRIPATIAGMFFPPVGMALSAYDTIRTGDPRNLMGMLGGMGGMGALGGAAGSVGGQLGGAAGSLFGTGANPFMSQGNPFMDMLMKGSQFNPYGAGGSSMFSPNRSPFGSIF